MAPVFRGSRPPARTGRRLATVVAGVALDAQGEAVAGTAEAFARIAGARLVLVHAIEPRILPWGGETGVDPGYDQALISDRRRDLEDIAGRLGRGDDSDTVPRVEVGSPHRVLLQTAERFGADLLVVGPHTGRGPFRRLLGSTADRLLARATCPTLVVRDRLRPPLGKVLAPVDLSLLAADSLRCGVQLLAQVQGDRELDLEALTVLSASTRGDTGPADDEAVRRVRGELSAFVTAVCRDLPAHVRVRVSTGEVRQEILDQAATGGTRLVLLGTHGRSGFERFTLGSVASAVAWESPISVLLVPPPAALGTALADAVLEQTEPHWEVPSAGSPPPPRAGR